MIRLEERPWWPELVRQKDRLSLRELAQRFSVTPGAISAALRRVGLEREAAPPGPREHRERVRARQKEREASGASPRGRGSARPAAATSSASTSAPTAKAAAARATPRLRQRTGRALEPYRDALGRESDTSIAQQAGVSVPTVARWRAALGIAPYTGRAQEAEGPGSRPRAGGASNGQGTYAWRVRFSSDGRMVERVVFADDVVAAAREAAGASDRLGEVTGLDLAGALLA